MNDFDMKVYDAMGKYIGRKFEESRLALREVAVYADGLRKPNLWNPGADSFESLLGCFSNEGQHGIDVWADNGHCYYDYWLGPRIIKLAKLAEVHGENSTPAEAIVDYYKGKKMLVSIQKVNHNWAIVPEI